MGKKKIALRDDIAAGSRCHSEKPATEIANPLL
jgi:hypothetical protein